jgi:hypothetical protein
LPTRCCCVLHRTHGRAAGRAVSNVSVRSRARQDTVEWTFARYGAAPHRPCIRRRGIRRGLARSSARTTRGQTGSRRSGHPLASRDLLDSATGRSVVR